MNIVRLLQKILYSPVAIAVVCSLYLVNQLQADEIVFLEVNFDFEAEDAESASLEKLLQSEQVYRPIIGLNQIIRGNAPGVIKIFLREKFNAIEIVWPGLGETPIYSFNIDRDNLLSQAVEVIVSSLSFGLASYRKMEPSQPVIVVEPNTIFYANIIQKAENLYSIVLPSEPIESIMINLDYRENLNDPSAIEVFNYGDWTFEDWNSFRHVTATPDQTFISSRYRDPSDGSLEPLNGEDFAIVMARWPTDTHQPKLLWTLRTNPPGASIRIGGSPPQQLTEATMRLLSSEAEAIVFEKTGFVQCPYVDATPPLFPKPGKATLECKLEPIPTR